MNTVCSSACCWSVVRCYFVPLFWQLSGFWGAWGPGRWIIRKSKHGDRSEELQALLAESLEYEAKFEEISVLREPSGDDIHLLKEALKAQRAYTDRLHSADRDELERLEMLNRRYQNVASREYAERSAALEKEALQLVDAGDLSRLERHIYVH